MTRAETSARMSVSGRAWTTKPLPSASTAFDAGNRLEHLARFRRRRAADFDVERRARLQLVSQFAGLALRDDSALVHDQHAVADLLGFRQDVRAEQDGVIAPSLRTVSRISINCCGSMPMVGSSRMITGGLWTSTCAKPSRWRMPFREVADQRVLAISSCTRSSAALTLAFVFVDAAQFRPEGDVAAHGHIGVDGHALRQIADAAPRFHRIARRHHARRSGSAFARRHEAGQHTHGAGFARAVGTEQADDFAFFRFEADVINRKVIAVAFGQVGDFDHKELFAAGEHLMLAPASITPYSGNADATSWIKVRQASVNAFSTIPVCILSARLRIAGKLDILRVFRDPNSVSIYY